jgi:hypothetical protein
MGFLGATLWIETVVVAFLTAVFAAVFSAAAFWLIPVPSSQSARFTADSFFLVAATMAFLTTARELAFRFEVYGISSLSQPYLGLTSHL